MTTVYFVKDRDPQGGHYAVYTTVPVMSEQRPTVDEVRKGDFPQETLDALDRGGEIIPDEFYYLDDLLIPYWEDATPWWTREEGYLNKVKGGNK